MARERQRPDLKFQGLNPALIVQSLQQRQQMAMQQEQMNQQRRQERFNNILNAATTGFSIANQAQQLAESRSASKNIDETVNLLSEAAQNESASFQRELTPQPSRQIDSSSVPIRPAFTQEQLQQPQLSGSAPIAGPTPGSVRPAQLQSPIQQFAAPQAPQGSARRAQIQQQLQSINTRTVGAQALARSGQVPQALELAGIQQAPQREEPISTNVRIQAKAAGLKVDETTTASELKEQRELRKLEEDLRKGQLPKGDKSEVVKVFNSETNRPEILELRPGESLPAHLSLLDSYKQAPSAEQAKTAGFAQSMASADESMTILEDLADKGITSFDPKEVTDGFNVFLSQNANATDISPLITGFRRQLGSAPAQMYFDAMLDFVLSDTRRESGAAIKTEEIVQSFQRNVVFGGDTPEAAKAKSQRRKRKVSGTTNTANAGLRPDRRLVNEEKIRKTARNEFRESVSFGKKQRAKKAALNIHASGRKIRGRRIR